MPFVPPREVRFSLFFFKSLAGLGIGIIGMLVLGIFIFPALRVVGNGAISGPFLIFAAVVMGLVTALVTNCLGVFFFNLIDREKYPNIREILKHVIALNILIFIFLLPIYFLAIVGTEENVKTVILVASVQLVASALASMFVLELSNSENSRQNLVAIYGIMFAILTTIVVNALFYQLGQIFSTPAELAIDGSGGKGVTIILFAILPTTWLFFGIFTTAVEMIYRWIYQTWGRDLLNE